MTNKDYISPVIRARDALLALNIKQDEKRLYTLRPMMYIPITTREGVDEYFAESIEYNEEHLAKYGAPLNDDCTKEEAYQLLKWLNRMRNEPYGTGRETLTELALSLSLCPLHMVDYAACFDDDDPECVQIRFVHPTHDT